MTETAFTGELAPVTGYLDLRDEGYGFVRAQGYLAGQDDTYVSVSQARRFALRRGDFLEGGARPAGGNEKYAALMRVDQVSGLSPEEARERPRFDSLPPVFPTERLTLDGAVEADDLTIRMIDLLAPIGRGQRGLLAAPPKSDRTRTFKRLARAVQAGSPEAHLIVLVVDERPEEISDLTGSLECEVVASAFDRPTEEHVQVAELVLERAKRLAEVGRDVVVLFDGISRLARAYNLTQAGTGRVASGGIDTGSLHSVKRFLAAGRNIQEAGTLTLLATVAVDTGSRTDDVIYEEVSGTANMEVRLDRRLAERHIYPAVSVSGTGTRHDDRFLSEAEARGRAAIRQEIGRAEGVDGDYDLLAERLRDTKTNDELLAEAGRKAR